MTDKRDVGRMQQAGPPGLAAAPAPPPDDLSHELLCLNRSHTYEVHAPITSHRKLAGRVVVALKKRLRPWLYGTLAHVFEGQQEFNRIVVRYSNASKERLDGIERRAGGIEASQGAILEKLESLDVKIESYMSVLSNRIGRLEARAGADRPGPRVENERAVK